MSTEDLRSTGVIGSFEPVNWSPPGLPDDPDEIVAHLMDPHRRGEVYPLYHQLRRVAPIHRCRPEMLHGSWVVTRFADTDALMRSPDAVNDPQVVDQAFNHGDGTFYNVMRNAMLFLDSPSHQRVRSLVVRAFTPRSIARWRPIAERVATELCDAVAHDGGMELVAQYNYELPFNVIAHILGVPAADFPRVKQLAWDFARAGEKVVTPDVAKRGDDAARGFIELFEDLAEERRSRPTDDLISSLVQVEEDGDRLSREELVGNCILLMQAGHETTQDLLGNAMVALFRDHEQLVRLRNGGDLMDRAVEEFLRYDSSVQINHRLLRRDMALGDVVVPAGDMVYLFLGAANRDPAQFDAPDRLDITRPPQHHVAFAFGAYYCVGASLARTEVEVGIRTLLDRFPGIRPARDTFEWRDTLQLRGPRRVEVEW
ncbi:MAG TPA: cytochrome P450 [Acidimicrobiales bacterium]|nr:cytochrome P450 [Acidimicrobiales bacterium]